MLLIDVSEVVDIKEFENKATLITKKNNNNDDKPLSLSEYIRIFNIHNLDFNLEDDFKIIENDIEKLNDEMDIIEIYNGFKFIGKFTVYQIKEILYEKNPEKQKELVQKILNTSKIGSINIL